MRLLSLISSLIQQENEGLHFPSGAEIQHQMRIKVWEILLPTALPADKSWMRTMRIDLLCECKVDISASSCAGARLATGVITISSKIMALSAGSSLFLAAVFHTGCL